MFQLKFLRDGRPLNVIGVSHTKCKVTQYLSFHDGNGGPTGSINVLEMLIASAVRIIVGNTKSY